MKFYSGFSLKNERYLFVDYIKKSDFSVCGFSYGAIYALNYTLNCLNKGRRVDTIQLFSPLFFQNRDEKFKHQQLMAYKKNKSIYIKQFIKRCFAPYEVKIVENQETTADELKELLEYKWSLDKLQRIQDSGVKIEVYLGGKDSIIDTDEARDFFLQVATVTYIKDANHFLWLK